MNEKQISCFPGNCLPCDIPAANVSITLQMDLGKGELSLATPLKMTIS